MCDACMWKIQFKYLVIFVFSKEIIQFNLKNVTEVDIKRLCKATGKRMQEHLILADILSPGQDTPLAAAMLSICACSHPKLRLLQQMSHSDSA